MIKKLGPVLFVAVSAAGLAAPAAAQSTGGFSSGGLWVMLGIASLIACIIAAFVLNFKINITKNNEHGVTMYSGTGDYMKHLATQAVVVVLLGAWLLASFGMIVFGIM